MVERVATGQGEEFVIANAIDTTGPAPFGLARAIERGNTDCNARENQALHSAKLSLWRSRMGEKDGDSIGFGINTSPAWQTQKNCG